MRHMRLMSDDSSSIDEAEFLSACGDPIGDCAIWAADERSEASWTEVLPSATASEENGWADYYARDEDVSEVEADLGITERAEASSDRQPAPGAFPGEVRDDNLRAGILARGADVLRAEENPWDTETAISRVVSESALQEPIIVDVPPRATTNGVTQPTGDERLDGAAFNHRSERDEAGPAPRSDTQDDAHSPPGHKKSKKRRKNDKPSSKQEHREDHHRAQGNSSRAAEAPRRHGSGRKGRNRSRRRLETQPPPTPSRSRNRSRDHTGSTVRSDSGSGSARFNVTYVPTPRIDSNQSHLYKGFCWGWKPSWWPESWWWPDTTR